MTGRMPPPQYGHAPPPAPNRDEEHLRLLSIFHYVLAGIMGFFGCMPFIHVGLGLFMLTSPGSFQDQGGSAPPPFVGWLFLTMGSVAIVAAWTLVTLLLIAARKLRRRRNRTFCIVVAGISCIFMPMGTVLGVFTIIVLARPTVMSLFEAGGSP